MSTRSIIAVAHDSGSWEQVRDYAIRAENGYWSSYAPPSEVARLAELPDKVTCWLCDGTGVRSDGRFQENGPNCNGCSNTGQTDNRDKPTTWRANEQDTPVNQDDDCGAEWAYLLSEKGIDVLESRYRDTGDKAIGMFGSLNGDHYWAHVGTLPWDADAQAIDKIECGENYERCGHYVWVHVPELQNDPEYRDVGMSDYLTRSTTAPF